ncbi:MAG: sigma-70 factor domain-containing protein, partial [Patescibacteria group bacterium]
MPHTSRKKRSSNTAYHKTHAKPISKAKKVAPKKHVVTKKAKPVSSHKPTKTTKSAKPVIKTQAQPKVPYVKVQPPSTEDLDKLFDKARTRSFMTETEILYAFPDIEDYIPTYEAFIDRLDAAGISVVEMKEGILGRKSERQTIMTSMNSAIPELGVKVDPFDLTADHIQIYLREIGKIPLLKAEEEISLAKRKEKGDKEAEKKLIEANLRLV